MDLKQFLKLLLLIHQRKLIVILLILLFVLAIANEFAIYNIGLITGDYYQIMNNKDKDAFITQTIKSVALIVGKHRCMICEILNNIEGYLYLKCSIFILFSAMALLKSLKEYVASFLYIQWRDKLTGDMQDNYFVNIAYYRLNVLNVSSSQKSSQTSLSNAKTIRSDNVDQRITQDVDKMTNSLSYIIPEIIVSPFIIGKL